MFPALAWSWFFEDWRISDPAVGRLGRDFFEEAPGWFYFKNAKHAAEVDFVDYDPREPALSRVGANDDGLTMVEGFARDLIPIAILHTAGVMKLYLDEAYAHRGQPAPEEPLADPPDAAGCAATGPAADGSLALLLLSLVLFAAYRRRNRCAA
jgi:MYXO-CTERM domain-containing protein